MSHTSERSRSRPHEFGEYAQSLRSVMLRDMQGNILFWNRAAERNYGWSKKEAVGNQSHRLLNTVFPAPLEEINTHLMTNGFWEGVLIHTLSDGARVKVRSRWELEKLGGNADVCVVETNTGFSEIVPESAHLVEPLRPLDRIVHTLKQKKWWWITPLVASLLVWEVLWELTNSASIIPLIE